MLCSFAIFKLKTYVYILHAFNYKKNNCNVVIEKIKIHIVAATRLMKARNCRTLSLAHFHTSNL